MKEPVEGSVFFASNLLNIANYSDKSHMCLFAAAAHWIRLPSPQRGRGVGGEGESDGVDQHSEPSAG